MSSSTNVLDVNFVEIGTVFVPELYWPLLTQLLELLVVGSTAGVPSTALGDKNEVGFSGTPTSPESQGSPSVPSPLTEPAMDAAPTTTPGDAGAEKDDPEGCFVAPGAVEGAGAAPPAAPRAGGGPLPGPALPARPGDRRAWSRRTRRRPGSGAAGSVIARTVAAAGGAVIKDEPAPAPACCAACGTPGVRTEAWVCGVCDEPFILGGKFVLSLDFLDEELAAGGLHCESCGERRPLFERLACTGCSAPARHIGDVLTHNRREQGRRAADAVVDAQVELPDDGITTDPEIEALLPRDSSEVYILLEQDLRDRGCLSPLVVWQDGPRQVLLDGHTRHTICRTYHIPFEKKILEFPDRTSAIRWVLAHQLGRRNLSPEAQAYLRGRIYNLEKRQGARTDLDTSRQGGEKLSERLADVYKVSSRTIERDGRFAAHLDHLAVVYGVAIKKAVLARDAKMTRAEVARAVRLDAPIREHLLARIRQGAAAVDVLREAVRDRTAGDRLPPRRHATEHEGGRAETRASPTAPQARTGDPSDGAPTSLNPPGAPYAGHLDEHPVAMAIHNLETAVRNLKQGELSPLHARRLEQRLSEVQQALAARLQVRAGWSPPHAPAALAGGDPARVNPAIEAARG